MSLEDKAAALPKCCLGCNENANDVNYMVIIDCNVTVDMCVNYALCLVINFRLGLFLDLESERAVGKATQNSKRHRPKVLRMEQNMF